MDIQIEGKKKMTKTLTLAEALRELERVNSLLQQRYANITRYCSKKKGSPDEMSNQKNYVAEQKQSAMDLLTYYTSIKIKLNKANLEATFDFNGKTLTVAEAILYKHYLANQYRSLWNSFTPQNAMQQLSQVRIQANIQLTPEQLAGINMVPELYYNEKIVQKEKEDLEHLMSSINALIDQTNHNTTITV